MQTLSTVLHYLDEQESEIRKLLKLHNENFSHNPDKNMLCAVCIALNAQLTNGLPQARSTVYALVQGKIAAEGMKGKKK